MGHCDRSSSHPANVAVSMCPSVRRRPESLDLCSIAPEIERAIRQHLKQEKRAPRPRFLARGGYFLLTLRATARCGCLAGTIHYWMMAPLSQSRITPARHQTVLTFVSIAGTNNLLPDAALESNLGIWLRRSKCNQGSNTQKSLLAP